MLVGGNTYKKPAGGMGGILNKTLLSLEKVLGGEACLLFYEGRAVITVCYLTQERGKYYLKMFEWKNYELRFKVCIIVEIKGLSWIRLF